MILEIYVEGIWNKVNLQDNFMRLMKMNAKRSR